MKDHYDRTGALADGRHGACTSVDRSSVTDMLVKRRRTQIDVEACAMMRLGRNEIPDVKFRIDRWLFKHRCFPHEQNGPIGERVWVLDESFCNRRFSSDSGDNDIPFVNA